jgi:hypothetical protein
MSSRVRFWIVAVAMTALVAAAGCGDNDNNGNGNDNDGGALPTRTATPAAGAPTPTRTATPAGAPSTTPTPAGTASTVTFTLGSGAALQSVDVRVAYPTAKGGFRGSADDVECTSSASGAQFIPNDKDDGTLILIVANSVDLTFPITVTCTFDATSAVTADDFSPTVNEVVSGGVPGSTGDLQVEVGVS